MSTNEINPAAAYVVMTGDWYLRSTTWTSEHSRASKFENREAAIQALARAKKFMRHAAYKAAKIVTA